MRNAVIGFIVGIVLTVAVTSTIHDKQVTVLKAQADSISVYARLTFVAESLHSIGVAKENARLKAQKQAAITMANNANARVDVALSQLVEAKTAQDTIARLRSVIDTFQHHIVPNLFQAIAKSDSMFANEHERAERLESRVGDLNRSIQTMAMQINKLRGDTPKWLKTGTEVVKYTVVFAAGFEAAKRL